MDLVSENNALKQRVLELEEHLHLLTFQTPILYILFENYIKLFLGIK